MKIYFIKYKTLYSVLTITTIIILICLIILYCLNYQSKETFNELDDVYYKGNLDEKVIAFTCNVDWGEEFIPSMLEIFSENNVKITFFVTGTWARSNPDILLKIYNEGHEIGNHGYFHRNYGKLSYEINKEEIQKADKIITEVLGIKSKYFAPPAGDYSENTLKAAKDLDYKVIMWTLDTIDWRNDSTKEKIIKRVINKPSNSAIVLMHPKEETIKALPAIISFLKNRGYKIGKVSDVLL